MLGFGQKQNKIRISVGSNEDAELKPVQKRETQELPVTLLDLPQVAGEAGDSKQSDEVLVVNLASPESATSDDAEVNLVVEVENETPPK